MIHQYLERILRAKVYDVAIESPLDYAPALSKRFNNRIYFKREDLQPVFSFKLRGAYNKMALLNERERQHGVIAASAGNHAQGVALSAHKLGLKSLIVMPLTTPEIKISSVKARGAEAILFGDSYDEAYQHALQIADEKNLTFVHPYDDPDVIAGQGTIGMEILHQHNQHIDAIFVPVGGGGLIAGIAAYVKFVRPETQIIAVEPNDADCLNQAMLADARVSLPQVGLFADGVAVKQIGRETFKLAQQFVDKTIVVNTDEICAAIKDIFDDTRSVAEPAGALAVAGLKKYIEQSNVDGQTLIAIESGANINFDRLRYVAERTQVGEHREILLAVTIPEQPGSFLNFCQLLGNRSITEFNYRYFDDSAAQVFVGLSSSGIDAETQQLKNELEEKTFQVFDMTSDELAKDHIRYMVGGHAPQQLNEVVYSLQFPERPGALLKFLTSLNSRWNISMFHYRNHGAAFGKVLIGLVIPRHERKQFKGTLETLGFAYQEETHNQAYRLFVGGRESMKKTV